MSIETIRERIIQAVITRLTEASATWETAEDADVSVYRAVKNIDGELLPACVLWPGVETVERKYGQHECSMPIAVEAIIGYIDEGASEAQEALLGDIIKAIVSPSVVISTLIDSCQYTGGGPQEYPAAEGTMAGVKAEFIVKYRTLVGNPFANGDN